MKLEQEMVKTDPGRQLRANKAPGGEKKKLYSTEYVHVLKLYKLN